MTSSFINDYLRLSVDRWLIMYSVVPVCLCVIISCKQEN